jgi:hypothetical protein
VSAAETVLILKRGFDADAEDALDASPPRRWSS